MLKLTYRELFEALHPLGYVEKRSSVDGRLATILVNEKVRNAEIFLPRVDPEAEVISIHLLAVRATLQDFGLIGTDPARDLMARIKSATEAMADS